MCCHGSIWVLLRNGHLLNVLSWFNLSPRTHCCVSKQQFDSQNRNGRSAVLSYFRNSGRKMDVCEGDLLLLDNVPGLRTLLLTNLDLLHFFKETWYS